MIDFRYHVVSIVAVFLALALGLFIGSTTLVRDTVAGDITRRTDDVVAKYNDAQAKLREAQGELSRGQAFDNALIPYVIDGRLAGSSVVVVSAPDADGDVRDQLADAVIAAGASVTGDVRLQDALLDPEQEAFLTTLTERLLPGNRTLPAGTGNERALALLADALGTRPQQPPLRRRAAERILSAYRDANLISVAGDDPSAGSLALLVAGAPAGTDSSAAAGREALLAAFARNLDRAATGAVVSGPVTAAAEGGLLDLIRGDQSRRVEVSTVDSAELPSGVMATVLALAEQARGKAGSYGVAPAADAPLPTPTPS